MAMQDNEEVVAEEPATHKVKAQKFLVLLAAAIVGALLISVMVKIAKKPALVTPKTAAPAPKTTAANSEEDFQERLKAEQKRRELQQAAKEKQSGQTADETIAQLEAQRDEAAAKAGLPRSSSAKPLPGEGSGTKSPIEAWEQKEMLRALDSRRAALKVQGATTTAAATPTSGAASRGAGGDRGTAIPSVSSLAQEQSGVQAELARVKAIRSQLTSGGLSGSQLADAFTGTTGDAASDTSLESTAPTGDRKGQTVGKPASADKKRKPGDVLVSTGTVGRAVLDQDVISDYPGPFRAMLIDDIYDVSRQHVVAPRGSRVVGNSVRITNVNEPISARMGLLVQWIVMPDGSRISMDRSPSLDAAGVAGIKDQVNRHIFAQVMGVAAYALVSSETSRQGSGAFETTSFEGDLGESMRKQFAPIAQKYLALVPTITLRSGTPMRIFIEDDIYAQPWSTVNVDLVRSVGR